MVRDVYSPPEAPLADPADALPVRPKAVIFFFVVGYGFFVSAIALLLMNGVALFDPTASPADLVSQRIRLAVVFAFLLLLGFTLFAVHRRSKFGQILGLIFILINVIPGVLAKPSTPQGVNALIYGIGFYVPKFGYIALIAGWAYAFGLTAKARAYFGYKVGRSEADRIRGS